MSDDNLEWKDTDFFVRQDDEEEDVDDEDDEDDDSILMCWCGATGTYDDLFDDTCLSDGCGGTRHVDCYCGGDQCVCHHHGQEVECPGCAECRADDRDEDWIPDDDDDDHFTDG